MNRTDPALVELRGIHQALAGLAALLEVVITGQQETNRLLLENGRILKEIRDSMPKYGRRLTDL